MMHVRTKLSALFGAAALLAACGGSPTQPSPVGTTHDVPPIGSTAQPPTRPLTKTSFVAFGDSITAGTITTLQGLLRLVVAPDSYPYKLQNLLESRHPSQRFQVYNEGVPGEEAATGVGRLPGVMSADSPQVVLLLQGVDDLDPPNYADIPTTVGNLQTEVQEAQAAGAVVMVGTLLPQRRGGLRAWAIDEIQPFNAQLKTMVKANGAILVDLYTPFAANLSLIGPDGLHPTAAGYTKMAQIWADAIDAAFSIPLPSSSTPHP